MTTKVYFTDMRAKSGSSLLTKLGKLYEIAGFDDFIKPKDLVALKIHFGEKENTGYIRPQFVRRIVDNVKKAGGKPFLTDANTLYVGSRANSVDHLEIAIENGFAYAVVGAPLIIADGLTGKEYRNVEVNLKHFDKVKIGTAALDADSLIAISHVKGHELTGFGGALKNIGMGLGSRSGKQMMHSDMLPKITEKCITCGKCKEWCPTNAIKIEEISLIDENICIGCGECTVTCPVQAIKINWKTEQDTIQEKIVEYTVGALKGKEQKSGFINFVMNVTPECDCCGWSDAPIVSDVGILASRDPIAIDQASIDLINMQKGLLNSKLGDDIDAKDKIKAIHPHVDWETILKYGEKVGLGTRKYELIKI